MSKLYSNNVFTWTNATTMTTSYSFQWTQDSNAKRRAAERRHLIATRQARKDAARVVSTRG